MTRQPPFAYEAPGWDEYRIDYKDAYAPVEPLAQEIAVVDAGLEALVARGVLPHARYDGDALLAHRAAVVEKFDMPWTAITPRMQRLLYAINAIHQPRVMVAVGIFCGNTFISNAGAAIGPGACYRADRLVGLEIRPQEAARAARNVSRLAGPDAAEILGQDGIPFLQAFADRIDLLYLDADGTEGRGKSIYLDLLECATPHLRSGSLVLAHNSVNAAPSLGDYLSHVRADGPFRASVNMVVDGEGLEVSQFDGGGDADHDGA